MAKKFKDLIQYFEDLAKNHVSIQHSQLSKHFYRFEVEEVLNGLRDINYPAMILESYTFDYRNSDADQQIKTRRGAFILIDHISDSGDFDKIYQTFETMEEIANDMILRIREDKAQKTVDVLNGIDMNGFDGVPIANDSDQNYGVRVSFNITSVTANVVDNGIWGDKA